MLSTYINKEWHKGIGTWLLATIQLKQNVEGHKALSLL